MTDEDSEGLLNLMEEIAKEQVSLPADMQEVLDEHFWDLLA